MWQSYMLLPLYLLSKCDNPSNLTVSEFKYTILGTRPSILTNTTKSDYIACDLRPFAFSENLTNTIMHILRTLLLGEVKFIFMW